MEKLQALRMTYLAWFLGEVLPDRFFDIHSYNDFTGIYGNETYEDVISQLVEAKPKCGTTACAIGWCPTLFPKDWFYTGNSWHPTLGKDGSFEDSIGSGRQDYFGITYTENERLFYGDSRTGKEEAEMLKQVMLGYGWNYDACLEEAKLMFGADLADRFQPTCPTEPAPETWDEDGQ